MNKYLLLVDTTAKKSFKLRQFLFGDSNNHSSSCSNSTIIARNNNNQTIDNNDIKYPIVANRLANCDYFTPPSHVATVSRSVGHRHLYIFYCLDQIF